MGIPQIDRFDYYGKLEKYLKVHSGKTELDFTTNEIDFYNDFIEKLENENHIKEEWEIEYLHNCKKFKEYFIDKKRTFENSQNHPSLKINDTDEIDFSNTTAVEKIIYLKELGIIEFLRDKTKVGISNSSLASVISGITGIKPQTIKPSLNRLSNNDTDDKNHPYYNEKTVNKIKLLLSQKGF